MRCHSDCPPTPGSPHSPLPLCHLPGDHAAVLGTCQAFSDARILHLSPDPSVGQQSDKLSGPLCGCGILCSAEQLPVCHLGAPAPPPPPIPFHFLPWHAIGHASASLLSPQHGEFLRARGSVPSPQYLPLEKWLALFTASVCRTEERLVLIRMKLAVDTQMPPGRCSFDYFTWISSCRPRGALDGALIFLSSDGWGN